MSTLNDSIDVHTTTLDQGKMKGVVDESEVVDRDRHGLCAICLDKIVLQETALVKGCEHAYCVTCILRWASYHKHPKCPQCKNPFESLNLHRSLDGSIHDFMFEESLCLLLRATWFKPLVVEHHDDLYDELEELGFYLDRYHEYEDEDEDEDEAYFSNTSSLRIGNRRWGSNGYVRSGRQEARPANRPTLQDSGASSSRGQNKKEVGTALMGRRAKRALKREAADKAAAAKHQQQLTRLGRN